MASLRLGSRRLRGVCDALLTIDVSDNRWQSTATDPVAGGCDHWVSPKDAQKFLRPFAAEVAPLLSRRLRRPRTASSPRGKTQRFRRSNVTPTVQRRSRLRDA